MADSSSDAAAGSSAKEETIWTPPATLAEAKLIVMHEKPNGAEERGRWEITNAGFSDAHIPELLRALHHSECTLEELDLAFNKLTDAGLMQLVDALGRDGMCGYELTSLRLGANLLLSPKACEVATELLKQKRPDLKLDFEPTLKNPKRLLTVGKVFPDSPAAAAGLERDDYIVAIGMCNFNGKERNRGFKSEPERHMDAVQHFKDVAKSLKPLVTNAAAAGAAIDVIVERGIGKYLPLELRPAKWSGEGLLGAKIGLAEETKP